MPLNRSVAALTPLAAILAGVAAEWLAKHFPGVEVPRSALEEIFLGGMAAVLAPSAMWLLGWQKHEAREATTDGFEEALEEHELTLAEALPSEGEEDELVGLDSEELLTEEDVEFGDLAVSELGDAPDLGGDEDPGLDDDLLGDPFDDEDDDDLATAEEEDDALLAELLGPNQPSRVG